ncbi:MAG: transposase [Actinoallomurus sp.]
MDKAFAAFFKRVRQGRTPGFPRFKGRGWFDTVTWPKDGDGCRWDSQPEHPGAAFVRLQGIGHVRVHQHRPVAGRVKTISLKREGSRWFVVPSCDDVPAERLPATGAVAGVDLGVASLATTSDGEHLADPRRLAASAERLAAAGHDLARKKRSLQGAEESRLSTPPDAEPRCVRRTRRVSATRAVPRCRWTR